MIPVQHNLFPGGKRKCVTLSYDDGVVQDRRLVEILNRHGMKGTFHLNSSTLGQSGRLELGEIRELFRGHEVSAHSVTHPHLETLPPEQLVWQILEDRRALESLVGYPVRGMSYPYGTYTREIVEKLPAFGIEYARTTQSHGRFHLPDNLLLWDPTCHHKAGLMQLAESFVAIDSTRTGAKPSRGRLQLFYIWGHSYEFDHDKNWDLIETFCTLIASEASSIWFATNMDIVDYLRAMRQLRVSVEGNIVQNPSHRPVWISVNGEAREVGPGATLGCAPPSSAATR